MDESLVKVTNNDNPVIDLEITAYNNIVDIDFTQSIESCIASHNVNSQAHKGLFDNLINTKADTANVNTLLLAKADASSVYTKSETDTKFAQKVDVADSTVTKLGNTFNGASQLVQLNSDAKLPALDASLLKNIVVSESIVALGSVSSSITLSANKVTTAAFTGALTITLPDISDNTRESTCIIDFTTTNASYPLISTTSKLKWSDKNGGKAPASFSTLPDVRNVLKFTTYDSGVTWRVEYSIFGGVETLWIQPTLYSDGDLGGASFAVYSAQSGSSVNAYLAFNNAGGNGHSTQSGINYTNVIMYNPNALRVVSFDVTNWESAYAPLSWAMYGSMDNAVYNQLANGINGNTNAGGVWTGLVNSQTFYKYYKLYLANNAAWLNVQEIDLVAYYIGT